MDIEETRITLTLTSRSANWGETAFLGDHLSRELPKLSYQDMSGQTCRIGDMFDVSNVEVIAAT